MKKQIKLMAAFGVATVTLLGASQISTASIDTPHSEFIKSKIEMKQEIIKNNPYIPEYKKDMINDKLEAKKDIIDSKVSSNTEKTSDIENTVNKKDLIDAKLDAKKEIITNNPYIPQYKKDIINNKLDIKKNIIDSKYSK